ncbi:MULTISPECIES: hypothetical protein [unclassified Pseudoalteromonas]|uniref:hypothetical protein n=1 Tax=unclassified Pseudoalteromonas TaxID=194690 RepID=UPI0015FFA2FC|nr:MULTISPECIES: hypothetical protein [unclassified Pseudoalteromonas]MBB1349576.1 hypothetical protein [Pseudoalteromonas sp. SG45-3]MBB1358751.1 hypothetical protein [Pseudoalteromonas sp. SG45-6]
MARRSEFKGIVRNFAHMLNNRNNDHLGYWAMGQLCLLAEQENISSVSINLLEVESNCVENSLDPFAKSMRKLLIKMLNSHKIPSSWLKSANVTFSFNEQYQKQYHYWRSALGTPYLVTLEITSDLGQVYKQIFGGNVNPHDPRREQRRAGF